MKNAASQMIKKKTIKFIISVTETNILINSITLHNGKDYRKLYLQKQVINALIAEDSQQKYIILLRLMMIGASVLI